MIVKNKRRELGLSQQTVASAVGLQIRQYQRFEYGERLVSRASMKQGLKICAVLELDPFELVFGEEPVLYELASTTKTLKSPEPILQ